MSDWIKRRITITYYEQAILELIKSIPKGKYLKLSRNDTIRLGSKIELNLN